MSKVESGILELGLPDGELIPGVLAAARSHDLQIDSLSAAEVRKRFPGLFVPDDVLGVFEKRAGFLRVEACVKAHLEAAMQSGAHLQHGETVWKWAVDGDGVVISTDRGRYRATRLIITAGAWTPELLSTLGVPMQVLRKTMVWYPTQTDEYTLDKGFPVWIYESAHGAIYGFPEIDELGFKVARHDGGTPVADPLQLDRDLTEDDRQPLEALLRDSFAGVVPKPGHHAACMYTMSPDGDFIVDCHPEAPQVSFVAGLSGHGFKMASALGEAVCDLAMDDGSSLPIDFLSLSRF